MNMLSINEASQKYERLMYKLAASFGFSNSESKELVTQVGIDANGNFEGRENQFVFRILLSKIMVRKCIFKLSNKMFSQDTCDKKEPGILGFYSEFDSPYKSACNTMPLTLFTVYVLNDIIGFTELEIAEILNISSSKVKERRNKTWYLLNNCSTV